MKLTLKTKPHPVWLVPPKFAFDNPGVYYYRAQMPAKMCGGQISHGLQILNRARQIENFNPFDVKQLERLEGMPEATTIFGLGSPTVIPIKVVGGDAWLPFILALRNCGVSLMADLDDDMFLKFSQLTEYFKRALKERGIPQDCKMSLLMSHGISPFEVDAWWQGAMPGIANRGLNRAIAPWSMLLTGRNSNIRSPMENPICSTEPLRASIQKRLGSFPVAVCPNVIAPPDFPAALREGPAVRVGYAGTATHNEDVRLIMPSLAEVAKLPNAEIVLIGWFPGEGKPVPGNYERDGFRYRYKGAFHDFQEFNRQIGEFDIALAPLEDTEFNRCKSPQKWVEHAMHRTPMVLSDGPVYGPYVTHGVTGFLAKDAGEFTKYVLMLAADAELRGRIGEAARQAVLARHTVDYWRDHWRRAVGVENAVLA